MVYNPHTYLALARAREEELLREARRHALRPASWNERPSVRTRLAALVGRRPARRALAPAA
jgi:hypothetical protein